MDTLPPGWPKEHQTDVMGKWEDDEVIMRKVKFKLITGHKASKYRNMSVKVQGPS